MCWRQHATNADGIATDVLKQAGSRTTELIIARQLRAPYTPRSVLIGRSNLISVEIPFTCRVYVAHQWPHLNSKAVGQCRRPILHLEVAWVQAAKLRAARLQVAGCRAASCRVEGSTGCRAAGCSPTVGLRAAGWTWAVCAKGRTRCVFVCLRNACYSVLFVSASAILYRVMWRSGRF